MKLYKIFYLWILLLILSGCTPTIKEYKAKQATSDLMINKLDFDPKYKNFQATVKVSPNLSAKFLEGDTTLNIRIKEFTNRFIINSKTQPQLVNIRNIRKEELKDANIEILTLVDLTLEQEVIDKQKKVIYDLLRIFPNQNIEVAFFKGKNITETMRATDYVMNTYFRHVNGTKLFYKGVQAKYKEISQYEGKDLQSFQDDSILSSALLDLKSLIILSDGKVYDSDDNPIDSNHFQLQRSLSNMVSTRGQVPIIYINLRNQSETTAAEEGDSDNILKLLCMKSGGKYFDAGSERIEIYNVLDVFKDNFTTYTFYFQNPDFKIYRGAKHELEISCYQGDSLLASNHTSYYLGSVYSPIIVNGRSTAKTVVIGFLIGLLIIFILYLILQFLIPFVDYKIFEKKYVTRYTGKNMCFNNVLVNQECYFCKAPFEEGDEIVVKCEHVVHKSCWDENGYKCPEHGMRCKTGSHYYNDKFLADFKNAPYYSSWILVGALAGLFSWILFITQAHNSQGIIFAKIIPLLFNVEPTSAEAAALFNEYGSHLLFLPFYGLNMGFFLTLALSALTGHGKWWWKRTTIVIIKAFLGALLGCVSFIIGSIISIALDFTGNSLLIDWIPWLLSGCSITFIIAYGTDIKLKKALIGATVSVLIGLGSTYLWSNPYGSQTDTRMLLLVGYMLYCIGFAYSIAVTYPKSERYFLRVEGPIKEMDIALYKWMNAYQISRKIFIGKSVDCELQMTWDITSAIAPIQAKIFTTNGNIYLEAIEDGIYVHNKPMVKGQTIHLYHGSKFTIGKTIFTYIEKDL